MDSILATIKQKLSTDADDSSFDNDIIVEINTALFVLTQIGIGPQTGFVINDGTVKWSDFLGANQIYYEAVKTYIYLKVKLVFDPPASAALIDSMRENIKELECRLAMQPEILASQEQTSE